MPESYPQLLINQYSLKNRETGVDLFANLVFDLPLGKIIGIYGPSGIGKSLFCRSMVGLLPEIFTHSGSLKIKIAPAAEIDLTTLDGQAWTEVRRKYISIIFQDPLIYLNPVLTIGQQIQELADNKGLEHSWGVLRKLGFNDPHLIWLKYPHQLSGGQLQRVHLAITLVKQTPILIADEITTALDVITEREIMQYLRTLVDEQKMAVVFITHDKRLMDEFADTQVALALPNNYHYRTVKMYGRTYKTPQFELLKVEGLGVNYHSLDSLGNKLHAVQAVEDISFSLYPGEILGLVGETGSGKSSIGRAIAGLVKFDGRITIKGLPLEKICRKKRAQLVQTVFQDSLAALTPHLTVGELLMEVQSGATKKERITTLLEMVGLSEEYLNRYPLQLSGGQRQRVLFVRALLNDPQLLICDESIASLDENTQRRIIQMLIDLSREKDMAIIFITHDIAWVAFLSDKILVIKDGRRLDYGSAEELSAHSSESYTHALLSKTVKK